MLRKILLATSVVLFSAGVWAGPQCTDAPQDQWQDADAFQAKLKEDGYQIKKFKTTKGNCYEIYGYDKEGTKVEIYFNPIDGKIVKIEKD